MKVLQKLTPLVAVVSAISLTSFQPINAVNFGEKNIEEDNVAIIATPFRHGYTLMLVEQIPDQRRCWSEYGSNPVVIDPLLLEFDFTYVCKRSTDSNGYSIRLDQEDIGMDYLIDIVEEDGELHLVGIHRNPKVPRLYIGKTNGITEGSLKIFLNKGWQLTKRTYQGIETEHFYLSGSSVAINSTEATNCPAVVGVHQ
ncbi:MAG: DUF3747 domain-containing protein [Xenococcaceae cyanobacterium MO_167.B52]|nr:DUF3747 domain-containing protein [Xenococcaceae cyanobacterium MO_167.B52]